MILSFMTKWKDGSPTNFVQKIWQSFRKEKLFPTILFYHSHTTRKYREKFGLKNNVFVYKEDQEVTPKYHTIRKGNRWKAGMTIHFAINNRSKDYFQFAPVVTVKSVQKISINKFLDGINIFIDGRYYLGKFDKAMLEEFAKNDGFDTFKDFIDFFFPNDSSGEFEGQIIHWTNLRY